MAKLSDLPRNNGAETEQIIQKLLQRNMDILERARSKQPIRGNGFIMFRNVNQSGTTVGPMLQFRPGETTETARAREVEEQAAYLKRSIEQDAKEALDNILKTHNPYSETFKIKPDGRFDQVRLDGRPMYLGRFADTPASLYQLAAEIQCEHPRYRFSFEADVEGRWLKYTVTKIRQR